MADMNSLLAKLRSKTNNPAVNTNPNIPNIPNIPTEPIKEKETPVVQEAPVARQASKLGFELREKFLSLENALLEKHPLMPNLLRDIHTALKKQPENVILLNEEEIRILVNGLEKQTGTELIESTTKASSKKGAKIKVTANDLGL